MGCVRADTDPVANGELGRVSVGQGEYLKDCLSTGLEETGQKKAAWHTDPAFTETRRQLDAPEAAPSRHAWHEVIEDARTLEGAREAAA